MPVTQRNFSIAHINKKYSDFQKIYTDGSKSGVSTGFGIYSKDLNLNIKAKMSKITSIFQAEATAILNTLEKVDATEAKVVILTDSLSTVKATGSTKQKDTTILQIKNLLNKNKNVIICWIPSHVGIQGNEIADRLANEAHSNPDYSIENNNLKDLYKLIRDNVINKQQTEWNESNEKMFEVVNS